MARRDGPVHADRRQPAGAGEKRIRAYAITIDRAAGRVVWTVDGHTALEIRGEDGLPESVHVGFGFFTLTPAAEGSVRGQGGRASWRDVRYDLGG